ncbi:hypothetical protein [Mucilaginibacter lacusdianchii]|uniref:hypothetical protein n=1 Tax=Mucilaginibacter lacusdianchii TaxID=2684211 RepID=UPI00131B0902|nr:hypothetical protein [Mucilaginibacter sp. JXJ CY 39]
MLSKNVADAQTTPSVTALTYNMPLNIVVKDLTELKVNQSTVDLSYKFANDYINGIYIDIPNHLAISKTTPFDVYVKASNNTLSMGGSTIPVGLITLSPTPDVKRSFNAITLSATPQKLLSGAMPVIDKQLNVRFAISAENTKQLLGKAAGDYATTITYSIVAPSLLIISKAETIINYILFTLNKHCNLVTTM